MAAMSALELATTFGLVVILSIPMGTIEMTSLPTFRLGLERYVQCFDLDSLYLQ